MTKVWLNLSGTTAQSFSIGGTAGPTIRQGVSMPDDGDGNDGDIYTQYGASPNLYQKVGGTWISIVPSDFVRQELPIGSWTTVSTLSTYIGVINGDFEAAFMSRFGDAVLANWDASVYASLTLTSAAVDAWADQVAGYSLSQSNSAMKPAYNATGLNGMPAITSAGDDRILSANAFQPPPGCFVFVVAQRGTQTAGTSPIKALVSCSPTSGDDMGIFVWRPATDVAQIRVTGGMLCSGYTDGVYNNSFSSGTIAVLRSKWTTTTANNEMSTNGGTFTYASTGTPLNNEAAFRVFGGSTSVADNFFSGAISQIVVVDPTLLPDSGSAEEISDIESALAWKWGIQSAFPSDHIAKNTEVELPAVSEGKQYVFKDETGLAENYPIHIQASNTDVYVITAGYGSVSLVYTGGEWQVIREVIP